MAATSLDKPRGLLTAAEAVLRMHLDNVEVHPCDQNDDGIRAQHCVPEIQELFKAVQQNKAQSEGGQGNDAPAVGSPSAEALAAAIEQAFAPKIGGVHAQGYNHAIADIVSALRAGGYGAVLPTT